MPAPLAAGDSFFRLWHCVVVWSYMVQWILSQSSQNNALLTVQSVIVFHICHIVFLLVHFLLSIFLFPLVTGPATEMIHISSWHRIFIHRIFIHVCENLCAIPFLFAILWPFLHVSSWQSPYFHSLMWFYLQPTWVIPQRVSHECLTRVSHERILQKCSSRMFWRPRIADDLRCCGHFLWILQTREMHASAYYNVKFAGLSSIYMCDAVCLLSIKRSLTVHNIISNTCMYIYASINQ